MNLSPASLNCQYEMTDMSSGEFTITTRQNATATMIIYLAMETDVDEVNLIEMSLAASTGNQAFTGMGFQPDFVQMLGGLNASFDVVEQDDEAEPVCNSFMTATKEYNLNGAAEDAVGTSNTHSRIENNKAHRVLDGSKVLIYEATLDSFDSDGLTLAYTTAGQASKYLGIGFKAPAVDDVYKAENLLKNLNSLILQRGS